MARNFTPPDFDPNFGTTLDPTLDDANDQALFDLINPDEHANDIDEADESRPSLPIILLSAASGIGAAIIALYVTYNSFGLGIEWSAGIATLCLSVALGGMGALLSAATGSRAAVGNIAFSCGLILITLLFFALCTLFGALAATFILTL